VGRRGDAAAEVALRRAQAEEEDLGGEGVGVVRCEGLERGVGAREVGPLIQRGVGRVGQRPPPAGASDRASRR
jgi:hypothetical protein